MLLTLYWANPPEFPEYVCPECGSIEKGDRLKGLGIHGPRIVESTYCVHCGKEKIKGLQQDLARLLREAPREPILSARWRPDPPKTGVL